MKFSSSFKVGLLTLLSLILLVGVVLKVKGRALTSAKRIEINFKDVNGMRTGSGVQMMGLKVGQVEQITPVIDSENSYVKVKFVITEPNIEIPKASVFSIQQSGLIGELFLEITPPKTRTIYIPMENKNVLYKDDAVQMKLDEEFYDVGKIKNIEVVSSEVVPFNMRESIKTKNAYKVDYIVNLPGLILPEFLKGKAVSDNGKKKLLISTLDNVTLPYPTQTSPYTIVEPMRISDFMEWQYRAAESLTETNKKVNEILSDEVIAELKSSIKNINSLTNQTAATMSKVDALVESSQEDIKTLMALLDRTSNDFNLMSNNINQIIGDPEFKTTMMSTANSMDKLAQNINKIIGNEEEAEKMAADIREIAHNANEISGYINGMTKDDQLKKDLTNTVANANKAMINLNTALASVNKMTPEKKTELQAIIDDTKVTTCNLRKFSEKLNKRFLLWRLMF
ncbi:MCE family protein [bacterium]|nr:MCE family protein [bacterium]